LTTLMLIRATERDASVPLASEQLGWSSPALAASVAAAASWPGADGALGVREGGCVGAPVPPANAGLAAVALVEACGGSNLKWKPVDPPSFASAVGAS
jgi:hypothetical protein